jgi:Ca2+-binding RTX toxin-like protein
MHSMSVTPDPITGSGASMFFRWELNYEPSTGEITSTEFHMGAPVGVASAPLVRWPAADNNVGSATYNVAPSGVPVSPGNYSVSDATIDGVTTSWSGSITKELNPTSVSSVQVTLQKEILGVWVELPALTVPTVDVLENNFLTPGDYYMKAVLTGAGGSYFCLETYYTTAEGSTAPFVLHPVTTKCAGLDPTISGTAGNNVLTGTDGVDVIAGLGGNDKITGKSGKDVICGGDGNDTIDAGGGNDKVDAGNGSSNSVEGGSGNDILTGGTGADTLNGGSNDDTLDGAGGADKLSGGSDKDKLTGNTGSPDSCDGGSGTDSGGTGCETTKSIP